MYRVAQSAIADGARARARSIGAASDEPLEVAKGNDGDDLAGELAACVALFVSRLPSPYREAITLTELQGLTQKDAAEMLGVSLAALKSRVLRGREKIRGMFEQCCRLSIDCRGRITECEPRAPEDIPADCRRAAATWAARRRR